MAVRYKLTLKENSIPKDVTLLSYGNVFIETEALKYPSGLEYIHNECVGAFIRENGNGDVNLYLAKDFGETIGCVLKTKDSVEVYYLSGYDKRNIIEDIMVTTNIKKNMLVAERVEE